MHARGKEIFPFLPLWKGKYLALYTGIVCWYSQVGLLLAKYHTPENFAHGASLTAIELFLPRLFKKYACSAVLKMLPSSVIAKHSML